jgi:predicted ester cyclase
MTAGTPPPALHFHPEIFVQGKLDVADEIIAPDFVWHAAGIPDTPLGPAGVKHIAAAFAAALGDLQIDNEDVTVQDDRTVYRWTARAIHRGELFGIPPTGKQVTMHGFDLFRTAGGKLVELWVVVDRMEFLEQVGASITPGDGIR